MNAYLHKYISINGCQVPVYVPVKERRISINVKRIITGVIFGSLLTAVGAIPFLI